MSIVPKCFHCLQEIVLVQDFFFDSKFSKFPFHVKCHADRVKQQKKLQEMQQRAPKYTPSFGPRATERRNLERARLQETVGVR